MIEALNMQLDPVRTVLSNKVNKITVCSDLKRETGVFYTMISIYAPEVRRAAALLVATEEFFTSNSDFRGSFAYGDTLNIVFLYRDESRLSVREAVCANNFAKRKQIATRFLIACVETQVSGSVGALLLEDCNINMGVDEQVYFNYFLDFAKWDSSLTNVKCLKKLENLVFEILTREYALKYEGGVYSYPDELQVFYKKISNNAFLSIGSIITFVKMLPDKPQERRTGFLRILDRLSKIVGYMKQHGLKLFVWLLLITTVCYAAYQIYIRIDNSNQQKQNITYNGLDHIGEVYLGDETI